MIRDRKLKSQWDTKCYQRYGVTGVSINSWYEDQFGITTFEKELAVTAKVNIYVPCDSAINTAGHRPNKNKYLWVPETMYKNVYSNMILTILMVKTIHISIRRRTDWSWYKVGTTQQ